MAGVKEGIIYSEEYMGYKYHFQWKCCRQDIETGARIIDWALVSDNSASYTKCSMSIYFYDKDSNFISSESIYPWKSNYSYASGEYIDYDRTTCPLNAYYIAIEGYCELNGGIGLSIAGSWTLTDEYIPNPSTISCNATSIGKSAVITITRYDLDTSVDISYSFGSQSGTIVTGYSGETYTGWVIPTSFYDEMTDVSSKRCTLTAVSKRNGVTTGTDTCSFAVTIDSTENAPSVDIAIIDTNSGTVAITKDETKFIKNYSTAEVTVRATAFNGATVSRCIINSSNGSADAFTATFPGISDGTFEIIVTDSRGISTTQIFTIDMVDYKDTTCTISASPPTADGATDITIQGTYTNSVLGATENTLTVQYRKYAQGAQAGDWIDVAYTTDGSTFNVSMPFTDLDYKIAYIFEARAVDKLSTSTCSVITKATPVFSWSNDDFEFNVPVSIDGKVEALSAEISGDAEVQGDLTIGGELIYEGTFNIGTLTVAEDSTVGGALTANSLKSSTDITSGGTLNVTGKATVGSLGVTGDTTIGGNVTVTGNLTAANIVNHVVVEEDKTTTGWNWHYREWNNGWVECWGESSGISVTSNGGTGICYFPCVFKDYNYVANFTGYAEYHAEAQAVAVMGYTRGSGNINLILTPYKSDTYGSINVCVYAYVAGKKA